MGAWIEILTSLPPDSTVVSLLSWERGLKWLGIADFDGEYTSLLSWERGLKFLIFGWGNNGWVAPLVGAWIEILLPTNMAPTGLVAPLVGAWIEIKLGSVRNKQLYCRSSRGSVD